MPKLTKSVLSRYLGSECERQLRIALHPEKGGQASERVLLGMPRKQPPRPGLRNIQVAGDEWAESCLAEIDALLSPTPLVGNRRTTPNGLAFDVEPLSTALATATPGQLLAEHEFDPNQSPTFKSMFANHPALATPFLHNGHNLGPLDYGALRPDITEVLAPGSRPRQVLADGSVVDVAAGDDRMPLRVIDIKLTSEPGPGYFAEVAYYSIALAGWLIDFGFDDRYFVADDPALWPGSHEASAVWKAAQAAQKHGGTITAQQGLHALYEDLLVAPLTVFASRLKYFFDDTLPHVLQDPWQSLPFHVSSKCKGCDFLGDDRGPKNQGDPDHCQPLARTTEHLSRIPFLSRGAGRLLDGQGLSKVGDVAATTAADQRFEVPPISRTVRVGWV